MLMLVLMLTERTLGVSMSVALLGLCVIILGTDGRGEETGARNIKFGEHYDMNAGLKSRYRSSPLGREGNNKIHYFILMLTMHHSTRYPASHEQL